MKPTPPYTFKSSQCKKILPEYYLVPCFFNYELKIKANNYHPLIKTKNYTVY
jgi:hypothetical protein